MSQPPDHASSFLSSIFGKCLIIIAATGIIVAAAISLSAYFMSIDVTKHVIADSASVSTNIAADSIAGHLSRGETEQVDAVIAEIVSGSNGSADGAVLFGPTGQIVSQTAGMSDADLAKLRPLATDAQASAETRLIVQGLDIAVPVIDDTGTVSGVIAIDWSSAQARAAIRAGTIREIAFSGMLLLFLLAVGSYALQFVLRKPLKQLEGALQKVSDKDYDTVVFGVARKDEVGRISRRLDEMRQKLATARSESDMRQRARAGQNAMMETLSSALKRLAGGDLTVQIGPGQADGFDGVVRDFNATAAAFNDTIEEVVMLAAKIRQEAEDIGHQSSDLSGRTENQAATLEETAAALDQLTDGVRTAANSAREVEGIVQHAQSEASQSEEVVQKTINAMSEIEGSSSKISDIIVVIDDIAFQTNLLALNAGVEAARAGEAGRGFAVVAAEVRALAQRSSEAAREIKTLIGGSSEHVANGVSLVAQAGKALTAISERVIQIASLMSDMANNAQDQATNLAEINSGVGQLDQVTQRNAAMVEQTNAASQSLLAQSQALTTVVDKFDTGDGKTAAPLKLDNRVA